MRTIWFPASIWWANAQSMLSRADRRRAALLVTLNLAAAAIYFVSFGPSSWRYDGRPPGGHS